MKTQIKKKAILLAVVAIIAFSFSSCRKQQGCPTFSIETKFIQQ